MDWAIVSVAAMEAAYKILKFKLLTLSKQQLIDCATRPNYYAYGCWGGDPAEAYRYAMDWGMMKTVDYGFRLDQRP
jgi:hypothetical protein